MSSESLSDETQRLDAIAQEHDQSAGFTPRLIACRAHVLRRVLDPGIVLDLGCADGLLTAHLGRYHEMVVGVDASPVRLARAKRNCAALPASKVEFRRCLFEEFVPHRRERFDAVVLSCVLEHVPDPSKLLTRVTDWLRPTGKVVAIVPNSRSLHRRAGVLMGLLPDLETPGESDDQLDHVRLYTLESLREEFRKVDLRLVASGGYLLKPMPNDRMATLPEELINAYERLGESHPHLAAEIYAVGALDASSSLASFGTTE